MIAHITGSILKITVNSAIVLVGDIGYEVHITPSYSRKLAVGQQISFFTSFIVREDGVSLFGFETDVEKDVFEILIGISGIGPKTAVSVLDVLTPLQLADAVLREDHLVFKSVSGIGPKTAKIVLLQLKDKLLYLNTSLQGADLQLTEEGESADRNALSEDIILALCNMGVDRKKASKTVKELLKENKDIPAKDLLKHALRNIGSQNRHFGDNKL